MYTSLFLIFQEVSDFCLLQASVNNVKFNEESTVIISGSVDTKVKIWDTKSRSHEPVQTIEDCKVIEDIFDNFS